jgi:ParB family chromosome partitioning protein
MDVDGKSTNSIVLEIPLERLEPNPYSARVESPQIDELSDSLRQHGQLSPIKVRVSPLNRERYQIVFGHRRVEAAKRLAWKSIRAEIEDMSDDRLAIFALSENLERSDFTDYEIGMQLLDLIRKFNYSQERIAKLIDRSNSYVSEHIQLTQLFGSQDLDADRVGVKEVLQKLTVRQARILFREPNLIQRFTLAKFCIRENLGLKEMEKLVGYPRIPSLHSASSLFGEVSDSEEYPRGKGRANDIRLISEMIKSFLKATQRRDLRSLISFRASKSYSLLHNFAPQEILDAKKATELDFEIFKNVEEINEDIDGLKIYVFGKFAYAVFFDTYRIRKRSKWSTGKSRATFIFRKIDKKWYIVHEHWSPAHYEDFELLALSPNIVGHAIRDDALEKEEGAKRATNVQTS